MHGKWEIPAESPCRDLPPSKLEASPPLRPQMGSPPADRRSNDAPLLPPSSTRRSERGSGSTFAGDGTEARFDTSIGVAEAPFIHPSISRRGRRVPPHSFYVYNTDMLLDRVCRSWKALPSTLSSCHCLPIMQCDHVRVIHPMDSPVSNCRASIPLPRSVLKSH